MASLKISVSLTNEAAEAVEHLAQAQGLSVSEVIRRAIGTYKFCYDEQQGGGTFLLRHRNGDQERVRFIYA